jgi:predicted membrane metal-binding protein
VARAMLLGDRSFVDSSVVLAFQKTAAYHVLVAAGLHVGALVIFLWWVGKRLRFSMLEISAMTLLALTAYLGIVQDRPPILRAALRRALPLGGAIPEDYVFDEGAVDLQDSQTARKTRFSE